ncbi:uncharacterized protein N7479_004274 [Penicillium vulpinum]|uniref:Uncharacterized protein n=1 Tax=Penicillium vulpinum TaxID=29845 RepID=A0A1V6SCL5_9EURO|nr:uncharacterized protein N7479_004274 [Penicillium vulpinum]KAJ5964398.1 hypothetical protein N7479_004274 [Penicillium vulpinum]OQE11530.1 hypothetical protein PENVUL_c002G05231 [Penicillium vulpinum]
MLWSPLDEKCRQDVTNATAIDPFSRPGNVVTAAYYHRSAAIPLESLQPLIYNALSRVVLQIPSMGVIIHNMVDFIQLLDDRDEEVDALVEKQQNTRFSQLSEQVPCWRLVIAYAPRQNAISDMVACLVVGASAKDQFYAVDFHRSFLAALLLVNEAKPSRQPSEYPIPSVSKPLSEISTSQQRGQSSHSQSQSRFKTVTLGTTDTARLLGDCFANMTTLTSVIQAVFAASLFTNLTSEFSTMRSAGQISPSGITGKQNAKPRSKYIATHNREDGCNITSVWNEARRIHTASKAELNRKLRSNSLVEFFRRNGGPSLLDTKDIGESRGISVGVSSMGSFHDSKTSESQEQQVWQTGRTICNDYNNEISAALWITLVVGGDGCLTIGVSWLQNIIGEDWLEQVIFTMRRLIAEILHTNDAIKRKAMISEPVPWGGSVSRLVYMVRDLMLD